MYVWRMYVCVRYAYVHTSVHSSSTWPICVSDTYEECVCVCVYIGFVHVGVFMVSMVTAALTNELQVCEWICM